MDREVPKLASVTLETITPLHIGGGEGGGKAMDDECFGRSVPPEYRCVTQADGSPELVRLYRRGRDRDGNPYIPGSSLRGLLRSLYTGALDAGGVRNPEAQADAVFGSTDEAGGVALDDLLPEGPVSVLDTQLVRYLGATKAAGSEAGESPGSFKAELIDKGASFSGRAVYIDDVLPQVLRVIFAQAHTLTNWLCSGDGKPQLPNPERTIPGSPIHKGFSMGQIRNNLFQRKGDSWTIVWKLGRYAKSYAKALAQRRNIGLPHAYYLVQPDQEIPGWVRVSFDLGVGGAEFRLNEWAMEESG